jgi:hypothetical protein
MNCIWPKEPDTVLDAGPTACDESIHRCRFPGQGRLVGCLRNARSDQGPSRVRTHWSRTLADGVVRPGNSNVSSDPEATFGRLDSLPSPKEAGAGPGTGLLSR